ncbi:MAG: methyltransferase domain-containing protein [Ignavibacteriales bacterium]|nr:MAG: methyltransferase domain-containing protein [Ignavibacteriales bacterium]
MNKLLKKIFKHYNFELEKAVGDCKTLLDVGCGNNSPVGSLSNKPYCVGVDAFTPSLEKSRALKIHNEYRQIDVLDIEKEFKPGSFECVLANDLIEHLTKEDGSKLIEMMESIATKRVLIFTPNGFVPQREYDNNPWQVHKSGWTVEEMKARGYKVIGINGAKSLRGEFARSKIKPRALGFVVSRITQIFVRNKPEKAFQILCVKTK